MKRLPKLVWVALLAVVGVSLGLLVLAAVLWSSPSHEQASWPTRRSFRRQRGASDEPALTDGEAPRNELSSEGLSAGNGAYH